LTSSSPFSCAVKKDERHGTPQRESQDEGRSPQKLLAGNGGPTETMALLAGSAAIDAGNNALAFDRWRGHVLSTDQRGPGFPRIVNGGVDIGAFE
jgi:hypothetical protein